jgi:hypothetical protein
MSIASVVAPVVWPPATTTRCVPASGARCRRGESTPTGVSPRIVDQIFARLAKLNAVIESDTRNLGRGYVVGHSYFCQADPDGAYGDAWYERSVRFEIEPLPEESFVEDPDKVSRRRGC